MKRYWMAKYKKHDSSCGLIHITGENLATALRRAAEFLGAESGISNEKIYEIYEIKSDGKRIE